MSDKTVNYDSQDDSGGYNQEKENIPTILFVEDNADVLSFCLGEAAKSRL